MTKMSVAKVPFDELCVTYLERGAVLILKYEGEEVFRMEDKLSFTLRPGDTLHWNKLNGLFGIKAGNIMETRG